MSFGQYGAGWPGHKRWRGLHTQFDPPRASYPLLPCPSLVLIVTKRSKTPQPAAITGGVSIPNSLRSLWAARNMSSKGRATGCTVLSISAGVPIQAGGHSRNMPRLRSDENKGPCRSAASPRIRISWLQRAAENRQ